MPTPGDHVTPAQAKSMGLRPRAQDYLKCPDCGKERGADSRYEFGKKLGPEVQCQECRLKSNASNPRHLFAKEMAQKEGNQQDPPYYRGGANTSYERPPYYRRDKQTRQK